MPAQNRYFTGSTVSRYLTPVNRGWAGVVAQSGRPILDADLNLAPDMGANQARQIVQQACSSGWFFTRRDSSGDFSFPTPSDLTFVPNGFYMSRVTALVAGMPVTVDYTGSTSFNLIQLDSPPILGGTAPDVKRTDFVFLEVWLAEVSTSPHATATVTVDPSLPSPGDELVIGGVTLTGTAGAPGVDEFLIGADEYTTAANIASAINDGANSFTGIVTATSGGTDICTLKSVDAGAAGNSTTLTTTSAALTLSGATLSGGLDTANKPTQDTLYWNGNTGADASVNLPDDIEDPSVGSETTKRVQIQYRIRVTGQAEAVNFQTQADGFSNASILAQGGQSSPVATYPFVRADGSTVSGNSSAAAYAQVDGGLWLAGDGSESSATALGTVDGYVYALPICFVFRRNDAYDSGSGAGFDPLSNTNGGLTYDHALFVNPIVGSIPATLSDRPDGRFADVIVEEDVQDLRRHILAGKDLASELDYQMQILLDGRNTTWAIDAADKNTLGGGSGSVGTSFLVCNQIGRSSSKGGTSPTSGSTTRGDTIRDFDHVARRFGSAPVVEKVVFALYPTDTALSNPGKYVSQANIGYSGWAEDDEIHLDLTELNASTLGDWDPASASFTGTGVYPNNASVLSFVPTGTTITNVLRMTHDDGNYTTAVSQSVQVKMIEGLGTGHIVMYLDANDDAVTGGVPAAPYRMVGDSGVDDGSPRRIFVELEVSYPVGAGATDTPDEVVPDATVYPVGPVLENNTAQRPTDFENLRHPSFRTGYREIQIEYVANEPGSGIGSGTAITDSIVSEDTIRLRFPRRVWGSALAAVSVTDSAVAQVHNIDTGETEYGSSSRLVTLDTSGGPTGSPLSGAGQTLCAVTWFAQDPLPNYGALGGGYQVGVYYQTRVKPTVGVKSGALSTLPDPLIVEPLVMSRSLWTGQTGKGSSDLPFPYSSPLDVIPVNDGGTGTFTGEWYFAATASVSVGDFDATTGLLNLHSFVPVDTSGTWSLTGKDRDVEFRAFYSGTDPAAYRPTVMAQPLSSIARHKVFAPVLVRVTEDSVLFRKNELLLVVLSRFAELDADNSIVFTDTDNRFSVGVYRTQNLLITVGE